MWFQLTVVKLLERASRQHKIKKSNDENQYPETFWLRFGRHPILVEHLHFETHIQGFLKFKTHPYERHVPIVLHMEVTTPGLNL